MLVIRDAQKAVFADLAWDDFVATAVDELLAHHAQLMTDVPAAARHRRVLWSLQQARERGLIDGDHLLEYADCLLTYGPVFADHPAMSTIPTLLRGPATNATATATASVNANVNATANATADSNVNATADARWARLFAGMPGHVWRELALLADGDGAAAAWQAIDGAPRSQVAHAV